MNVSLAESFARFVAKFPLPAGEGHDALPNLCVGNNEDFSVLQEQLPQETVRVDIHGKSALELVTALQAHADLHFSTIVFSPSDSLGDDSSTIISKLEGMLAPQGLLLCTLPKGPAVLQDDRRNALDILKSLAEGSGLQFCDGWLDERGPRYDWVFVAQRKRCSLRRPLQDVRLYPQATLSPGTAVPPKNATKGPFDVIRSATSTYQQVLEKIHERITPKLYCEIGIRGGDSLKLARGDAIAIDPFPMDFPRSPRWKIYECGSDVFFDTQATSALNQPVDFAFIDGMHLFEYALRDFMNVERHASSRSVVAFDDIFPNHPLQAARVRQTIVWTGDIWKIVVCLRKYRPDLRLSTVDCSPTGLLIVAGLDPDNRVLWDRYGEIIDEFVVKGADSLPPTEMTERAGALDFRQGLPAEILMPAPTKPVRNTPSPVGAHQPSPRSSTEQTALSVIVVCHNMPREIPRTIMSLSTRLQRGIRGEDYEIILVDNGSTHPFDEGLCRQYAPNLKVLRFENASRSPVTALNEALTQANGNLVGVMIDGARMASPGLLHYALQGSKLDDRAIISSLGFHLGPDIQTRSVAAGYGQEAEDRMLARIDWQADPYRLFEVSAFAGGSSRGWFGGISESNALFMPKALWRELDGFDPAFCSPGGGLVNLDTYLRALTLPNIKLIVLLGEGTFHQVHGGVATNAARDPWKEFHAEYVSIRNKPYQIPEASPTYLGGVPEQVMPKMAESLGMCGYQYSTTQGGLRKFFSKLFK